MNEPSFVCPRCGAESFNPNDIRERYCSRCHVYTPTYICADCGCDVFDALNVVRERCLTCQWVADIPNEKDRERVRETLKRWNAR